MTASLRCLLPPPAPLLVLSVACSPCTSSASSAASPDDTTPNQPTLNFFSFSSLSSPRIPPLLYHYSYFIPPPLFCRRYCLVAISPSLPPLPPLPPTTPAAVSFAWGPGQQRRITLCAAPLLASCSSSLWTRSECIAHSGNSLGYPSTTITVRDLQPRPPYYT
ncbi:hypothetical protein F4808DRAFT_393159 [Astrocystis sublimbata]|nr:hypothetical protein F4808DRAFT_393159 [Astrocystis sublimbata]